MAEENIEEQNTPTGEVESGSTESQPSYDALQSELEAVKAQNQKYSTALHTFTKRLDKLETVAKAVPEIREEIEAPTKTTGEPNKSELDNSLRQRIERIEAKEEATKQREKLSAIKSALEQNGLDSDRARRFAHVIDKEQGDRIKVDEDFSVSIADGDSKANVNDWMTAYLQTDDGKVFLPPRSGSKTKIGDGSAVSNTTKVNAAEFGHLSIEQIKSGKYEIE